MDKMKISFLLILVFIVSLISVYLVFSDYDSPSFPDPQTQIPELNKTTIQNGIVENTIPCRIGSPSCNVTTRIRLSEREAIEALYKNTIKGNPNNNVTMENARNNARVALARLLYQESMGPGVIQRDAVQLYPEPAIIFDANGKMLFYEFFAGRPPGKTIVIDIAADRVLGSTVIRAGENAGPPADPESIAHQAQNIVDSQYPGYSIDHAGYVCYAYPLTGLEIILSDTNSQEQKRIFVTQWGMENERYIQSFYDRIPPDEYTKRVSQWERNNETDYTVLDNCREAGINLSLPFSETNAEKMKTILSL